MKTSRVWITPDGQIGIFDGTQEYFDTVANFAMDGGIVPVGPEAFPAMDYKVGEFHRWINDESQMQQQFPWAEGDALIANVATFIAARDARLAPPPPTTADKVAEIKAKANEDIIALRPAWKQRNMTAESLMMIVGLLKAKGVITQAEVDAIPGATEMLAAWEQVKARCKQSDDEEAAL